MNGLVKILIHWVDWVSDNDNAKDIHDLDSLVNPTSYSKYLHFSCYNVDSIMDCLLNETEVWMDMGDGYDYIDSDTSIRNTNNSIGVWWPFENDIAFKDE